MTYTAAQVRDLAYGVKYALDHTKGDIAGSWDLTRQLRSFLPLLASDHPPITFAIGDRVRISPHSVVWAGETGTITGYATTFLGMAVRIDKDRNGEDWHFHATEMEHLDAEQVDGDVAGTAVAGQPDHHGSGPGSGDAAAEAETPAPDPAMAPPDALAELTARVARLDLAWHIHNLVTDDILTRLTTFERKQTGPIKAMTVTAGDAELQDSVSQALAFIQRTGGEVVATQLTTVSVDKGNWEETHYTVLITFRER